MCVSVVYGCSLTLEGVNKTVNVQCFINRGCYVNRYEN